MMELREKGNGQDHEMINRLKNVIESCLNEIQIRTALKYVELAFKRYSHEEIADPDLMVKIKKAHLIAEWSELDEL